MHARAFQPQWIVAFGLMMVFARPVAAAPNNVRHAGPAGEGQEDPRYRALLSDAVAEYEAGHYEEARALFRRAHDTFPNARTLRGIGMTSFELRDYVDALRALLGSLTAKARPLTDEQRTQVQRLVDRSRAFVGQFTVKLAPTAAVLAVDGHAPDLESDGSVFLGFGAHTLEASCPSCETETRVINVVGGEHETIAFVLPTRPTAAGPVLTPASDARIDARAHASGENGGSDAGHATGWFIGAGAAAITTGGLAVWWANRGSELGRCQDAGALCHNQDALKSQRTIAAAATISAAAAAVGLAVVGFLSHDHRSETKSDESHVIACAPLIGGATCALTF